MMAGMPRYLSYDIGCVTYPLTTPMSIMETRTVPCCPGALSGIPSPRSNSHPMPVSRPHSSPSSTLAEVEQL
jgi:hypothetical protein